MLEKASPRPQLLSQRAGKDAGTKNPLHYWAGRKDQVFGQDGSGKTEMGLKMEDAVVEVEWVFAGLGDVGDARRDRAWGDEGVETADV